ncbi:hypothetical protein LY78DRAFT_345974 [Colletotrichum sublineola]|nr:hypothetical protein LY78DRAFT_345974 [Colletotrichum sublineola]
MTAAAISEPETGRVKHEHGLSLSRTPRFVFYFSLTPRLGTVRRVSILRGTVGQACTFPALFLLSIIMETGGREKEAEKDQRTACRSLGASLLAYDFEMSCSTGGIRYTGGLDGKVYLHRQVGRGKPSWTRMLESKGHLSCVSPVRMSIEDSAG